MSCMRQCILLILALASFTNGKPFLSLVKELNLNPPGHQRSFEYSHPAVKRRNLGVDWSELALNVASGICDVVALGVNEIEVVCAVGDAVGTVLSQFSIFLFDDPEECENSYVPPIFELFGITFGQNGRDYDRGCDHREFGFPAEKLVRCGDRRACCCPNGSFNPQSDIAKYANIINSGFQQVGCFTCATKPRCSEFISRQQCRQWQGAHNCDCNSLKVPEKIDDFEIFVGACRTASGGQGTYTRADRKTCMDDCVKDPKCKAVELPTDTERNYCELHTEEIAKQTDTRKNLCLVKKSPKTGKFNYIFNPGACRTARGGRGKHRSEKLTLNECESRCTNWLQCVAFEAHQKIGSTHCKLYTETITDATGDSDGLWCMIHPTRK